MKNSVKSKLISSLLALLRTYSYLDISVSKLCEKAEVSRVSFYRNFKTFDDLYNAVIDSVFGQLAGSIPNLFNNPTRERWSLAIDRIFEDVTNENGHLFHILPINGMMLLTRFVSKVNAMIPDNEENIKSNYDAVINTALILVCVRKWLHDGEKENRETIKEYLLNKILA